MQTVRPLRHCIDLWPCSYSLPMMPRRRVAAGCEGDRRRGLPHRRLPRAPGDAVGRRAGACSAGTEARRRRARVWCVRARVARGVRLSAGALSWQQACTSVPHTVAPGAGHTHVSDVSEFEGRCFVNPGSITGAFSPQAGEWRRSIPCPRSAGTLPPPPPRAALGAVTPSFTLMSIAAGRIEFFVYELAPPEGAPAGTPVELRISRSVFSRAAATEGSALSPQKLTASGAATAEA